MAGGDDPQRRAVVPATVHRLTVRRSCRRHSRRAGTPEAAVRDSLNGEPEFLLGHLGVVAVLARLVWPETTAEHLRSLIAGQPPLELVRHTERISARPPSSTPAARSKSSDIVDPRRGPLRFPRCTTPTVTFQLFSRADAANLRAARPCGWPVDAARAWHPTRPVRAGATRTMGTLSSGSVIDQPPPRSRRRAAQIVGIAERHVSYG